MRYLKGKENEKTNISILIHSVYIMSAWSHKNLSIIKFLNKNEKDMSHLETIRNGLQLKWITFDFIF